MVPYWIFEDRGLIARRTGEHQLRSICLAYLDSGIVDEDKLSIDVRGKAVEAVAVPYHLRSEAPPYARPIVRGHELPAKTAPQAAVSAKVSRLLEKTADNTRWRQRECINLIPSEITTSPMVRLLSVMDPAFRYAEHKEMKAFYETDVFYYQGTDFIAEVEWLLEEEMRRFLGCSEVEMRLVSGQMANATVFSAMLDYINRADRRSEPRRIRRVMNHHIGKGGHLSAQPMGALRDFVARDPHTERPAVVNFPVLPENPYKIDVPATLELIDACRPELIIFGKSMVLHREPVAEVRRYLDAAPHRRPGHVRYGARAGSHRPSLSAAHGGRGRSGDGLDPQDVLRHSAGGLWGAASRNTRNDTNSGKPFGAVRSPEVCPTITWVRCWDS